MDYSRRNYHPPVHFLSSAKISAEEYSSLYEKSVIDPETFWADIAAQELSWFKHWDTVFEQSGSNYSWFHGGKMNITYNCLDRHIKKGNGDRVAFISVLEDGTEQRITYTELLSRVNQCAHVLLSLGVRKGDTVTLYLPHIIEQPIAMLACARIGAIHSVVYAGFSEEALRTRIQEAQSTIVITADVTYRRGSEVPLAPVVRAARTGTSVTKTLIVRRSKSTELQKNELDFETACQQQTVKLDALHLDAEDPLFILYTSGTTGKPKGIVHTQGGYNLYTHYTTKCNFNVQEGDVYWCTADCGWITGHSYVVYGPLSNGVTSLLVEGAPDFPSAGRWWYLIETYGISVFYTTPTALRLLMKYGDAFPQGYDLSSLNVLGTVGEPINPAVWKWYHTVVGNRRCPIVDTWWQTETGGHMLVSFPSLPQKPGYAGVPFFGIEAAVVDKNGNELPRGEKGYLAVKKPWPAALRGCWNNNKQFESYWTSIGTYYATGDYAVHDEEGYFQILGRTDDVITKAGYRIGSAELENALVAFPHVVEAAVIGKPHPLKGESIKAFVTLHQTAYQHGEIVEELQAFVKRTYSKHAIPEEIDIVASLPKTRSGKIMRRLLKAKELGKEIGDVSTLED